MSATQSNAAPRGDFSWVVILALVAFGAVWLLTRNEEGPLHRSALGHDGLISWTRDDGIEVRGTVAGPMRADQVGIRILPLYDTDLETTFDRPENQSDYLATGDEVDIDKFVVERKLRLLKTLIIAPKWTRAMRLSGYAHKTLLLSIADASRALRQVNIIPVDLVRPNVKYLTIVADSGQLSGEIATLYTPQLFHRDLPDGCVSLIGDRSGHLLIECAGKKSSTYALSDPDMLNNHGLTLGENARLARRLLRVLSDEGPAIIDTTDQVFITPAPPILHKREWSDLMRFFAYPFSLIWLGIGVLASLALWRSGVRFGPPAMIFNDTIGVSKSVSIAAKGRLLRLSDNDRELMEAQADNMLQELATELLGPHQNQNALKQIVVLVARRNPELAAELSGASARVMTVRNDATVSQMLEVLSEFEAKLEKVRNEFGRTSVAG